MAQQSYFNSCAELQQKIYLDIMMFLEKQGVTNLGQVHCDLNADIRAVNVGHAREVALYSTNRQKDRRGRNYFYHLEAVASMFNDPVLKCIAYLHDVMEGSDTIDSSVLMSSGFHPVIVGAVAVLTRPKGMHYKSHLDRVLSNPLAVVVKLAELLDNSDVRALPTCGIEDYNRLKKYAESVRYLIQRSDKIAYVNIKNYDGMRTPCDEKAFGV